jgi:hypothetical protein
MGLMFLLDFNTRETETSGQALSGAGGEIPSTQIRQIQKHFHYEKFLQGNSLGKPLSLANSDNPPLRPAHPPLYLQA